MTVTNPRVARWVRGYSKQDDHLVEEQVLSVSLEVLHQLFGSPVHDPMLFDSYPLSPDKVEWLQLKFEAPLDFDTLNYFLECDAD